MIASPSQSPSPPAPDTGSTLDLWLSGFASLSSLVLALVAILALKNASGMWAAAREANEQAKKDSVARTRPYIFVELVAPIGSPIGYDLRIGNSGQSSAHNLTLDFSAWPETPDEDAQAIRKLFETPQTLPPRCEIRIWWRHIANKGSFYLDGRNWAGMPVNGEVTARYTSTDPSRPEYLDRYVLAGDQLGATVPIGEEGPVVEGAAPTPKQFYELGQRLLARVSELNR